MDISQYHSFKLDEMIENPIIYVIGKRGSGKSYLCSNILEINQDSRVTVISPTEQEQEQEQDNPFYCQFKNVKSIHYKYESSIIKDVIDDQKILRKEYTESQLIQVRSTEYNDKMDKLLKQINNITSSSTAMKKMDYSNIRTIQNLVNELADEKQKLMMKKQLIMMHEE